MPGPTPGRLDNGFDQSPSFSRMRGAGNGTVTPRPGRDAFRAAPGTYAPAFGAPDPSGPDSRRGSRGRRNAGLGPYGNNPVVLLTPPYYGPYAAWDLPPAVREETRAADAPEGFLRLLIEPRSAGVFVDGVYEGTADDFGGSGERSLLAGPHRIRLEADGYEAVAFDVRVPANDTVTFRRELEPRVTPAPSSVDAAPVAAAVPVPRKTLYVIPRCYLGDTLPQAEQLPEGCRLADLRTIPSLP
jgi:hypothetical protein